MGSIRNKRKTQIKESVLNLIFRDGIHKLSMKNLANEIGISEGTIYRYYPTKLNIIEDIINDIKTELIKKLREIADRNEPAPNKLKKYICYTIEYLHSKKGLTLVLLTEALYKNNIYLKKMLDKIYTFQKEYFINIVLDGIITGVWDDDFDLDVLAYLYMGIPATLNIETILKSESFDYKKRCDQLKKCIFKILEKK